MLKTTRYGALVRATVLFVMTLFVVDVAVAQPEQPDLTIDAATRTKVIDGVLKRLNDSYGHTAGDVMLHRVAQAIQSSVRRPFSNPR